MLMDLDIIAEELDATLPPGFSPNKGWFGETGCIMDLAYRALCIKRARDSSKLDRSLDTKNKDIFVDE